MFHRLSENLKPRTLKGSWCKNCRAGDWRPARSSNAGSNHAPDGVARRPLVHQVGLNPAVPTFHAESIGVLGAFAENPATRRSPARVRVIILSMHRPRLVRCHALAVTPIGGTAVISRHGGGQ